MNERHGLRHRVTAPRSESAFKDPKSRKPFFDCLASLGLGAIIGLGHAPVSFPFGVVVALPALGWLFLNARGAKGAFLVGMLAGVGHFGASMFWIVEPFLVEPEIHGWMAPFALVLTTAGMALFWAVPFGLASWFFGHRKGAVLTLAALWSLSEFSRSILFTGFPWGLIGYVWSELPLFQLVAIMGPFGLGFATCLVCLIPLIETIPRFLRFGLPALLLALALTLGWMRLPDSTAEPGDDATLVRIVQPNAEQHLKWDPSMVGVFFARLLEMTEQRSELSRPPDIIVWPETAFAFSMDRNPRIIDRIASAAGPESTVITGVQRRDDEGLFNSVLFIDRDGQLIDVYDKHHLVPFGEYVPLVRRLGIAWLEGLAGGGSYGFVAGPGPRVIDVPGLPSVLPLICYEAVFPNDVRAGDVRPGWLLHVTNDAWFGKIAGPHQHLVQARARAIEQGLPLARSANTGISAIIDPYGRVLAEIPLGTSAYFDHVLPEPIEPPLYARHGEWPWMVLALVMLLGASVSGTRMRPSTAREQSGKRDGGSDSTS